jgi:hypothetical protein
VIYQAHQTLVDMMLPLQIAAAATARQLQSPWAPWPPSALWPGMIDAGLLRHVAAGCEALTQSRLTHHRPDFGIDKITASGRGDICAVGQPSPRRRCAPGCNRRRSAITCRPGLAITASSADGAGPPRSIRESAK